MPYSYSSNISHCVYDENYRIFGLKSHDSHILMQHLLAIVIRKVLFDHVTIVLVEVTTSNCAYSLPFGNLFASIILHYDRPFNLSYYKISEIRRTSLLPLDIPN